MFLEKLERFISLLGWIVSVRISISIEHAIQGLGDTGEILDNLRYTLAAPQKNRIFVRLQGNLQSANALMSSSATASLPGAMTWPKQSTLGWKNSHFLSLRVIQACPINVSIFHPLEPGDSLYTWRVHSRHPGI